VPSDLDTIVLACLRRLSAERLQTAGEVLARLDALESREPTSQRRRALAPWAVAAGLLAGASYLALGTHERPSTASASEPPTSAPKAPAAPVTQLVAPDEPQPVKQEPQPEPPARQPSKRRPATSQPAASPKSQEQPQKSPDESGPVAPPTTDPQPGWEPFPGKR
jgi:outer membrane biosynthesis protein TonB